MGAGRRRTSNVCSVDFIMKSILHCSVLWVLSIRCRLCENRLIILYYLNGWQTQRVTSLIGYNGPRCTSGEHIVGRASENASIELAGFKSREKNDIFGFATAHDARRPKWRGTIGIAIRWNTFEVFINMYELKRLVLASLRFVCFSSISSSSSFLTCATERRVVHHRIVFIHVVHKNNEIFAAMCGWASDGKTE